MKITDGKRTVEIVIHRWNGSGFDPDWSNDYFGAGRLPYDPETDTYTVPDVGYCIDMAKGQDDEGACCMCNEDGEIVPDPDMVVDVTEIE